MSIECKKKTKNTHTQKKENKKYPPLPKKKSPLATEWKWHWRREADEKD